jgi:hypothetical protein
MLRVSARVVHRGPTWPLQARSSQWRAVVAGSVLCGQHRSSSSPITQTVDSAAVAEGCARCECAGDGPRWRLLVAMLAAIASPTVFLRQHSKRPFFSGLPGLMAIHDGHASHGRSRKRRLPPAQPVAAGIVLRSPSSPVQRLDFPAITAGRSPQRCAAGKLPAAIASGKLPAATRNCVVGHEDPI